MIKFESVTKKFGTGESALADINLSINPGEFVFVTGPSGSGKTTFFRLLTREIQPTSGAIHINDWNITKLPRGKVPHLRRRIGVVFQDLKLLADRTIFENILLPLQIAGIESKKAHGRVMEIMSQVGIDLHKDKFPVQLSGGELQRVAIARAIVFAPQIIIADEPTGNLDTETSWGIVKLLQEINETGTTVLMATHNSDIVKTLGRRIIVLDKGLVVKDEASTHKPKEPKTDEELVSKTEHTTHKKHKKEE